MYCVHVLSLVKQQGSAGQGYPHILQWDSRRAQGQDMFARVLNVERECKNGALQCLISCRESQQASASLADT